MSRGKRRQKRQSFCVPRMRVHAPAHSERGRSTRRMSLHRCFMSSRNAIQEDGAEGERETCASASSERVKSATQRVHEEWTQESLVVVPRMQTELLGSREKERDEMGRDARTQAGMQAASRSPDSGSRGQGSSGATCSRSRRQRESEGERESEESQGERGRERSVSRSKGQEEHVSIT